MRTERFLLGMVMIAFAFLTSLAGELICLSVGGVLFIGGIIVLILGLLQGESAILLADNRSVPRNPIEPIGSAGTVVFCEHCGGRVYLASGLCPKCGKRTVGQVKRNSGRAAVRLSRTMKCPSCGTESPDGARFCQSCGRPVTPGPEYRQAVGQRIPESPLLRPSYRYGTRKKSDIVLATTLILAGASTIALSSMVLVDLHGRSGEIRDIFLAMVVQAYVIAAVGVGMIVRRMWPRSVEGVPLLRPSDSPFISPAEYVTLSSGAVPGKRLGTGVRAFLYFISILFPLVGSIAGAILYTRGESEYMHVGKICVILAAVLLVVSAVFGALLYLAFGVPGGTG